MTEPAVFLTWSAVPVPDDLAGPWEELVRLADDLVAVRSAATLSDVYHELKWALPDRAALLVVPVLERPKLKGLPPGTTSWFRDRLPAVVGS